MEFQKQAKLLSTNSSNVQVTEHSESVDFYGASSYGPTPAKDFLSRPSHHPNELSLKKQTLSN